MDETENSTFQFSEFAGPVASQDTGIDASFITVENPVSLQKGCKLVPSRMGCDKGGEILYSLWFCVRGLQWHFPPLTSIKDSPS